MPPFFLWTSVANTYVNYVVSNAQIRQNIVQQMLIGLISDLFINITAHDLSWNCVGLIITAWVIALVEIVSKYA